ncbi:Asp-tRNA(Asn)/Glu-tRNA(Gln) amidotransferase subunit GatC [Rhodopirellula sp. JC740]|uniref:Aspartyl/glutamyl-tRNA(Asn/Gln) amidotransferase subunit C n=1 Tax=Rhodopirellula halodulae TaxID=2894198 RepID=A0ABS8NNL9_9BACT|nr:MULTISPECIES: Asp-tRNA(Asn)/Glu-tRNA(Gln) amidotransferase subunit GatC [unclassified Rhodopirellula]MCC9644036.1 Asp-tRNA(Asn)/Glu-tRNA(Gln) amidotransferase subunit GatC [Rhodopirellula sp. JC740]MCC9657198.1 Asp-tRNA(Asn)/Glu-tRNA(Gln) amidotransferase subunit GatC [Rhodopirellula sp. JC737]
MSNSGNGGSVDIQKLARLARLQLTEQEQADFGPQIADILGFVEQLSELDTSGVEPMTSALDVDNRFRDDVPGESLTSDVATRNAPAAQDGTFLVPPVLGNTSAKK